MKNKPDIMAFLKAIGKTILPHEIEPYGVFDGNAGSVSVVILKARQMHGTEFGKNVALFDLCGRNEPDKTVMHLFPKQDNTSRFVKDRLMPELNIPYTYLNERLSEKDIPTMSNISFKNGGRYYLYSAGLEADGLRGISADLLIRDEVDHFSKGSIESTEHCLSASKYPTSLDIGTPMGNGFLKKLWQQSDKREYFYCCISCDDYFKPTIDSLCGITDIKCPNCGKEQCKMDAAENGKWVQMRRTLKGTKVGYHFTQLINPLIRTVDIMHWQEEKSEPMFKAEVLGEF